MLNNFVNEELAKDPEIQVVERDLLYQEAVLECIEEHEKIDFLLLNEELPGEKIIDFIKRISNVKIILFTEKSPEEDKKYLQNLVYKVYQNGEITVEKIKQIIKKENYTEELEKEIAVLKKILSEKEEKNAIKNILNKKRDIRKDIRGKIISITGIPSISKTITTIDILNAITNKENKVLLINIDILNIEIEKILEKSTQIQIKKAKEILFNHGKKNSIENIENQLRKLKKKFDYIIIVNSTECFFEVNQKILEIADLIFFIIEKNIKNMKISDNLLKIYDEHWKICMLKVKIILNQIILKNNNIKKTTMELIPYTEENQIIKYTKRKSNFYKKLLNT